jgi:hypothetical protein
MEEHERGCGKQYNEQNPNGNICAAHNQLSLSSIYILSLSPRAGIAVVL